MGGGHTRDGAQEPLLVDSGNHMGFLETEPRFALCKASTLPAVLLLQPQDDCFDSDQ